MVPYLLRDVTAHQLLPRFVGMQPVAQIAPATGRLLKLFGDTTVGVTVYQLHGKRPAQLTQDGNLLQIQCIVFGVAGLNRRAHEYAALGIMLQNGLNGPTAPPAMVLTSTSSSVFPLRASSALPKLRSFVPIENTKTSGAG